MTTSSEPGAFESILDKSLDEITAPGNVPVGVWLLRGVAVAVRKGEDKDGTPQEVISLGYEPVEPGEGVDTEEVAKGDFAGKRLWVRRYIRDRNDAFRFKNFLALHGIDTSGRTVKDALDNGFKGATVFASVGLRSYEKDGETLTDNELKDFAAVA